MHAQVLQDIPKWKTEPCTAAMLDGLRRKIRMLELSLSNGSLIEPYDAAATYANVLTTTAELEALRWVLSCSWTEMFREEPKDEPLDYDDEDLGTL